MHAFEYFGGTTPCIVSDNAKVAVTSRPKEGEVVLNDAYREMAAHYGAAVMPARVKRPRDKPNVENEVWQVATEVVAALRDVVFTDINLVRSAVAKKVEEHNNRPFSKREGTRREVFVEEEQALLRPLPALPYEVCEWVYGRKVQKNCHVAYRYNFYSVSHLIVGKSVDLRITESKLEVFLGGERLATHPLFPSYVRNRYSTHEGDMPKDKSYSDWNSERIRRWAKRIGSSCAIIIERIFESVRFDEQGFNAALAVLRLSHNYTAQRLERACSMALSTGKRTVRYRDIEPILKSNQDRLVDALGANDNGPGEDKTGYVRGAEFYGRVR